MRILIVVPSLACGGAERVVSLLSQEWAREHNVTLALFDARAPAYTYGGRLVDLACPAGAGVRSKATKAFLRVIRLSRLIRATQPDRIITFMESANFPATLAAVWVGARDRLVVSVHYDPAQFPMSYRLLIPCLYRLSSRVVAVSRGVAESLARMGVPRNKLHVIPNPVALDRLEEILAADPLPLPNMPARFILGVGRLHPQKGFDRLLQAFAQIAATDLHLVILGEGGERDKLRAQAEYLGIGACAHLPGAVDNPFLWYRQAACFVLSSRYEGFANVLVEAMACGCPVVSFDCHYGPSEIIEDGVSGLLVPEGDVEGLAWAIHRVLEDESLSRALRNAGKERARQFDVKEIAKKWLT